jgi:diguanylate cyclase (GGDEF)-like protein
MRSLTSVILMGPFAAGALLLGMGNAVARTSAPPAGPPLYFEHLGTGEGLSQSTVNCVFQDSQGYLWLGTESGLDRYDGYTVRVYRRQRGNPHALANDYIWAIAEDAQGNLWIATNGGGIARWDRDSGQFRQFRHDPQRPDSLASDSTRTLLIDKAGRIWVGTQDSGLDVLDPRTGTFRHFRHRANDPHSLPSDAVYALYADHAGSIWVGTEGGLSRYRPSHGDFVTFTRRSGLSDDQVHAIYQDRGGMLWIGTIAGGLDRLDPLNSRIDVFRHRAGDPRSLSSDFIWSVFQDRAGRLWVGTQDGLDLLDAKNGSFTRYENEADDPHSLPDRTIMSLYQDRGGLLWVGTQNAGAAHWNPQTWLFGHYGGGYFHDRQVMAFADDAKGTVWIGTTGGLVRIDARSGGERLYTRDGPSPVRLSDDRVMSLHYGPAGVLWVGTMLGGLDRLDLESGRVRVYRHRDGDSSSLPADGIMALYGGRNGTLWVGTFDGGLARIDRNTGKVTNYPYDRNDASGLRGGRAAAIVEDRLGNIWVGTEDGGLNLFERRTGRFYHYLANEHDPGSLIDNSVYALHLDAGGHLWIGTSGGLDEMVGSSADPRAVRFKSPPAAAQLPSQVIFGIESDGAGRLWLSTGDGLARYSPRSRAIKIYHVAQGLQGEDFNFNAHYRGHDGLLYFGGNHGFNAFSPAAVDEHAPPPRIALTGVWVMTRRLARGRLPGPDRPLELAYDQKLVTFSFAALDYTAPGANRYAYRMEGFDEGWIDSGAEHRATYTNLPAGDYVFRVRAANADGIWSAAGLTIPIHVAAAPWDTTAARASYLLVTMLGLGYLLRMQSLRRERQLRYSRELELEVHERTRELTRANEQLEALSLTDALTGLANRRHFDNVLSNEWLRCRRGSHPLALMLLDVDWFKQYNDHYGHQAGDICLRAIGSELAAHARRGSDLAARYGGEEFVLIIPENDAQQARKLAEAIRCAVRARAIAHAKSPAAIVTVSIGVAVVRPADPATPELLLCAADRALYRAKHRGRDRVETADDLPDADPTSAPRQVDQGLV